jgi:hypothetical protein
MAGTYAPGLTLERIDNSKGYSPENCKWAMYSEQLRNTRRNVFVDTPLGRMHQADAAKKFGITVDCLRYRLSRGYSGDKLFSKTSYRNKPKDP